MVLQTGSFDRLRLESSMLSVRLSEEADKYYRISLQIPFSPHGPCYREETVRQIHVISYKHLK